MSTQIFTIKTGINRCYLVKDEGTILIDAGNPNKLRAFQKSFESLQIHPSEVGLILLTHGDFDHVGSVKDLKELTGAKIAIHEHDRPNLERSLFNFPSGVTRWGRLSRSLLNPVLKNVLRGFPAEKADIVLDENDYSLVDFGIAGKVVHTPGHTQGSVSVLLETGDALVGCMAHNNLPFRFRPGLPIFAEDIEKVKESWKSLIQRGAKTIYPAHGNPFSVDIIKKALSNLNSTL
jgi:glyoxylase-like metal-dependent hydrolase (beta-lactamase superfamily II)